MLFIRNLLCFLRSEAVVRKRALSLALRQGRLGVAAPVDARAGSMCWPGRCRQFGDPGFHPGRWGAWRAGRNGAGPAGAPGRAMRTRRSDAVGCGFGHVRPPEVELHRAGEGRGDLQVCLAVQASDQVAVERTMWSTTQRMPGERRAQQRARAKSSWSQTGSTPARVVDDFAGA